MKINDGEHIDYRDIDIAVLGEDDSYEPNNLQREYVIRDEEGNSLTLTYTEAVNIGGFLSGATLAVFH